MATAFLVAIARQPLLVILLLPLGGAFAVFLYSRSDWNPPVSLGIGARLGAVTGLITFALYSLLLGVVLYFQREQFFAMMKKELESAMARNPNPQAQQIVSQMMTPEGMAILLTVTAVFLLFMFLILCTVGGTISGNFFKRSS
ncbi:MAG TPA: hypothetical protein VM056_07260 [Terriglobales bacterium]|nr:hypothetical protein [Terriglobales bacterium]